MMKTALSGNDRLNLISNLGTMLSAGIPILEAVDSLLVETKGNSQEVLESLKKDLNQGKTIAESFERFPQTFNPVTVNLIRAAEEAGTLETTLKDLVENSKKEIETADKIKAGLAYPLMVMIAFIAVVVMILVFVIPRIAQVFSRLKVTLPLPTQILIATSNFLLSYFPFIIAFLVLLAVGCIYLFQTKKRLLLNLVFTLPVLSGLAKEIDLANFTRSMSLMLSCGIPIVDSLELSGKVANKGEVELAITRAKTAVSSGKKLSEGLKETKNIFPGVMILIIEAGEKSGTLEKSMQELSEYFNNQVANRIKTLTTLLEPILLVALAIIVGGMMLSIITPIYQLIGNLKPR